MCRPAPGAGIEPAHSELTARRPSVEHPWNEALGEAHNLRWRSRNDLFCCQRAEVSGSQGNRTLLSLGKNQVHHLDANDPTVGARGIEPPEAWVKARYSAIECRSRTGESYRLILYSFRMVFVFLQWGRRESNSLCASAGGLQPPAGPSGRRPRKRRRPPGFPRRPSLNRTIERKVA